MRILLVGFGPLARELSSKIKHFPEYGMHKGVYIYHIFVERNSLSYGRDLVVEIPDPHGDGYRTYKDGLQALDNYSTTVSNYKPWLLEEARSGAFDIILDCTDKTTKSYSLISEIKSAAGSKCKLIPSNLIGVNSTIGKLRDMLDGGKAWEPVEFSEEFLKEASDAWSAAQKKMNEYHIINRKRDISNRLAGVDHKSELLRRSCFSAIPDFDRDLVDRFVIDGDNHDEYSREEYYDADHDCSIVKHGILDKFFGWHHTEQFASREFLTPYLEIESAIYIKYLSDSSKHVEFNESKYVIEHVHKGIMDIFEKDGSQTRLHGGTPQCAYSYRPSVNPPEKVIISANLETIVFTYKETQSDN